MELPDLDRAIYKELATSMGYPEHTYADLPNMSPPMMQKFLSIMGDENIIWITQARRKWPDGTETLRGQILISPQGIVNAKKHTDGL